MEATAAELATATEGRLAAGDGGARATSFTIDSREATVGACFVAITGARDGHDYIADAYERGATVALVRSLPVGVAPPPGTAAVTVADPLRALGDVARACRRHELVSATVVAVSGSAGKTSTKDFLAPALGGTRSVHASPGSFNNEAGVPLTLLHAPATTDVVVAEFGERRPGDLAYLVGIARPDVVVVTQVGLAHAEFLGGEEGVLAEHRELVAALPDDGLAVLNADDVFTSDLARTAIGRVLTAGEATRADVRVSEVALDDALRPTFRLDSPWGAGIARLELRGRHQVGNAALAAASALALGAPIEAVTAGLGAARPAPWRMQLGHTADGITVVNDAYNASPTSMAAALRALADLPAPGRRIAVLGEMRELGELSEREHRRVGGLVAELGIDVLVVVGEAGAWIGDAAAAAAGAGRTLDVVTAPDADAALAALSARVRPGDSVLVKASRAVGLEHAATGLLDRWEVRA